jgi:hypothetical protein
LNAATLKNSSHSNENESYSHEFPKVQNMEEISLMALEKDLKTLEERNSAIHRKKKFSQQLPRFFIRGGERQHKYRN